MIGRGIHPLLPRPVPDPRPAPILSADRDGQGHRDHGAPPPGAYPRAPTQCARRLSPCGSGDPRRPLPVAAAMALALLRRHARDAPSPAPRAPFRSAFRCGVFLVRGISSRSGGSTLVVEHPLDCRRLLTRMEDPCPSVFLLASKATWTTSSERCTLCMVGSSRAVCGSLQQQWMTHE
jgi:hypothetical protein